MNQRHIAIYTDFDGTVTGTEGSKAVFSPFYNSLLVPGSGSDYKSCRMKSPEEVASIFAQNDAYLKSINMLMSDKAVAFFHTALASSDISVTIVTKNRADYIIAMLKHQGFSDAEISQLKIKDSGYKYNDVQIDLNSYETKAEHLYILDDSKADFSEMMRAAQDAGIKEHQISAYRCEVGSFAWDKYQEDISDKLAHYKS